MNKLQKALVGAIFRCGEIAKTGTETQTAELKQTMTLLKGDLEQMVRVQLKSTKVNKAMSCEQKFECKFFVIKDTTNVAHRNQKPQF